MKDFLKLFGLIVLWTLIVGLVTFAATANAEEICFPVPDAQRALRGLEQGKLAEAEAQACREWRADRDKTDRERKAETEALSGRVGELTQERDKAVARAEANVEAGKQAVKEVATPWWKKAGSVGKWIAAGVVAGYVIGTAAGK